MLVAWGKSPTAVPTLSVARQVITAAATVSATMALLKIQARRVIRVPRVTPRLCLRRVEASISPRGTDRPDGGVVRLRAGQPVDSRAVVGSPWAE